MPQQATDLNKRFRVGTKEHRDLLDALMTRVVASDKRIQSFRSRWDTNDEQYQTYSTLEDKQESRTKESRPLSAGVPDHSPNTPNLSLIHI